MRQDWPVPEFGSGQFAVLRLQIRQGGIASGDLTFIDGKSAADDFFDSVDSAES